MSFGAFSDVIASSIAFFSVRAMSHFLNSILDVFELLFIYTLLPLWWSLGFPGSSAGKESACNAGDPGSIPLE